jgi:small subunit ribosomal protein S16
LAVRIRLTRVGATKRPAYRVIAIDKRRSRDGRALEILGFYDPLTDPATVKLDSERIQAWISKGAQPSETVAKLMRQAERAAAAPEAVAEKPKRQRAASKPKATTRASKAKAAEPEAPAAEPDAPAPEASSEASEAAEPAETGQAEA